MKRDGRPYFKAYTFVEVLWNDAHGGDVSWTKVKTRDHTPAGIRSVGQVAMHDGDGITLVLSRDLKKKGVDCYIFIPNGCLVGINELVHKALP